LGLASAPWFTADEKRRATANAKALLLQMLTSFDIRRPGGRRAGRAPFFDQGMDALSKNPGNTEFIG
jgi:hypothetical protein